MSTSSTQAIWALIRSRALTFTPMGGGSTVDTLVGSRFYTVQAPDNAAYPYCVARLVGRSATEGFGGYRETAVVEIDVYARPRGQQWVAEAIADTIDQAFLEWWHTATGIAFAQHRRRETLPDFGPDTDREVVRVQLQYPVVIWPDMFTQYVS